MITCLVCSEPNSTIDANSPSSERLINCQRCGKHILEHNVFNKLQSSSKGQLAENPYIIANISGWIRENQNEESPPVINEDRLQRLFNLKPTSIYEKACKLLIWLESKTKFYGQQVEIMTDFQGLVSTCYTVNATELTNILSYLTDRGLIKNRTNNIILTAEGASYIEKYIQNKESDIGFCAMCFNPSLNVLWEQSIKPAISQAGYDPKRIDKEDHIDGVVDEILAMIRRSKFVIADLTDHRNGVYFEAGFAKGLGVKTIFICSKEQIEKSHFDVKHLNILVWEHDNFEHFRTRLHSRIESNLGRGKYIASDM